MSAELPIACTLGGADLAAQAQRWRRLRDRAQTARVESVDGIQLSFRDLDGVEGELRALVAAENGCCAWASWDVHREGDTLVMRATSRGEGVTALQSMLK